LPSSLASLGRGMVVGAALARYSYVSVRPLPPYHDYGLRVCYSSVECVEDSSALQHKAIKACLEEAGIGKGIEVVHQCDIPSRSGVGSSSTFVVGLLNALYAHRGIYVPPMELTEKAVHIEREVLGETVGLQDQTFAAHGGLNILHFRPEEIIVEPLPLSRQARDSLEGHLLIVYTGVSRTSSEVSSSYEGSLGGRKKEMWALMKLAEDSIDALRVGDFQRLGTAIDESFRIKAGLSGEVAPPLLQKAYAGARLGGAWGGKLMGAGGGGCFLLVAPPEDHARVVRNVREVLGRAVHIPVKFAGRGSMVILDGRE
jgi:D-glycero-alpha-D-manno-heptose-7-phosphate kinase